MSAPLKEFDVVRVRHLVQAPEDLNGWKVNLRPPAPGDVGVLLDILNAPGLPNKYVVECCGEDGVSIWLSDFFAEEIEHV